MKLALAVPLSRSFPVPSQFVVSYSHLQQRLLSSLVAAPAGAGQFTHAKVIWGQDFPVDFARNRLCQIFLDETDFDALLFLDTDMTHPPDLPAQLARHGKDVVTGRYVIRQPPFFSVAMRKVGPKATDYQAVEKLMPMSEIKGLVAVDAGGAGALFVTRHALGMIRKEFGPDWFRYQDGPSGLRSRSEDMWFYERCRDVGIQPYLDADARCGHLAGLVVDDRNHEPYAEAYRQAIHVMEAAK